MRLVKIRIITRQRRGQSMVEFVLLIGMVAAVAVIAKNALIPPMTKVLDRQREQVTTEAWKGGERRLESYYEKSCVTATDKGRCF